MWTAAVAWLKKKKKIVIAKSSCACRLRVPSRRREGNIRLQETSHIKGKVSLFRVLKEGVTGPGRDPNGCTMGTPASKKLAIMRAHYGRSSTVRERLLSYIF